MRRDRVVVTSTICAAVLGVVVMAGAAPPLPAAPPRTPPALAAPSFGGRVASKVTPASCQRDRDAAADRANRARAALIEALKRHAPKMERSALDAASKVVFAIGEAECCFAFGFALSLSTPPPAGAGMSPIATERLTCPNLTMSNKAVGGLIDMAAACDNLQASSATAGRALDARKDVPDDVKQAATDYAAAMHAYTATLTACAAALVPKPPPPPPPPPPTGQGLGGACTTPSDCQPTLLCTNARCARVAVAPGGACDANQLCGPALECRGGACRFPCTCPLDCVRPGGACTRDVLTGETYTTREDCSPIAGICGPPCFVDASHACKVDVAHAKTRTDACNLVCP